MEFLKLAVLWLGLLHSWKAVSGVPRGLLGTKIDLSGVELGFFGLVGDEKLLVQSRTDCKEPLSLAQRANLGLLCGWTMRARDCLEYTDTQPVWNARGCTGQECTAKNSYEETLCLLGNYGVSIDVANTSRSSTCGLDTADKDWLVPKINPTAQKSETGEPSCTVVVPKGIDSYIWADCVNGKPELRYQLRFTDNFDMGMGSYSCSVTPTCDRKRFKSMLACYSERDSIGGPESEDLDFTSNSSAFYGCCSLSRMLCLSFLAMWISVPGIFCH